MTDPRVGIIMGSKSDWPTMKGAAEILQELEVPHETRIVSAHRTPDLLFEYAAAAAGRGLAVLIAGAAPLMLFVLLSTLWAIRAQSMHSPLDKRRLERVAVLAVVAALVLTGFLSARAGGTRVARAIVRNVVGGLLAMAVTYGIGRLVGHTLG